MFKFINALGKLVVKLYFIEAKKLDKKAKADSQRAIELAKQSREKSDAAVRGHPQVGSDCSQSTVHEQIL
ncbi:hypothetical protein EMP27_32 [Klebsiella phage vB_KpnP_Emp27]|uniref:Uncharacterized protein n=1 Tax=Klebsiella phage vB_KpnP_Emp27 TaxID=2591364 RepID=A0A5B9NCX4_9CAUD|nr:hypothetical protein EMP27_32 [Klebsiella phage vB_KpnP_Emp27]